MTDFSDEVNRGVAAFMAMPSTCLEEYRHEAIIQAIAAHGEEAKKLEILLSENGNEGPREAALVVLVIGLAYFTAQMIANPKNSTETLESARNVVSGFSDTLLQSLDVVPHFDMGADEARH